MRVIESHQEACYLDVFVTFVHSGRRSRMQISPSPTMKIDHAVDEISSTLAIINRLRNSILKRLLEVGTGVEACLTNLKPGQAVLPLAVLLPAVVYFHSATQLSTLSDLDHICWGGAMVLCARITWLPCSRLCWGHCTRLNTRAVPSTCIISVHSCVADLPLVCLPSQAILFPPCVQYGFAIGRLHLYCSEERPAAAILRPVAAI